MLTEVRNMRKCDRSLWVLVVSIPCLFFELPCADVKQNEMRNSSWPSNNLFEFKRVTTNNNDRNQVFSPTSGLSWSSINNEPISWRNNDRQQSRGGRGRGVDPACFRQYREWNCGHPPGTGTWAGAGAMTSTSGPQTIATCVAPGRVDHFLPIEIRFHCLVHHLPRITKIGMESVAERKTRVMRAITLFRENEITLSSVMSISGF